MTNKWGQARQTYFLIYQALGQLDRARPYAQKAVDIMTSLFPHGHPNLDISRKNLEGLQR
jgi:hypothetical protein